MTRTIKTTLFILAFLAGAFLGLETSWADNRRFDVANKGAAELTAVPELQALRGKVVLLDFWASWCASCRVAMPFLSELQARYGADGFVVLGVNVDADRAAAEEVIQEAAPNFPMIFDPSGAMPSRFNVKSMPSSFLIDRDGTVVETHKGFRRTDQEKIEKGIERLIQSRAGPGV